jgi:protein-tyrosine phosphatase
MGYVDVHSHLLPGIDDGPESMVEALDILACAHAAGTSAMVATPHMFQPGLGSDDPAAVRAAFASLRERAAGEEDWAAASVEMHLGAENFLGEALLEAAAADSVVTLGGTRALLVELWPMTAGGAARHALDALLSLGYLPVLAHVERYGFLREDPSLLEELVAAGCVAQVNAGAVIGRHGLPTVQLVDRWLRRGLVTVVASDAHNVTSRPPALDEAASVLRSRHGDATADLCLRVNPSALLAGEPLTPPPSSASRRRWWHRR